MGMPKYHGLECKLFEDASIYNASPVATYKVAKALYMYLTPLRLLLKSETQSELMDLDANLKEREDTLIHFLALSHVVKPIHKVLGLEKRFSVDQIQVRNFHSVKKFFSILHHQFQKACGILDTNCFEIKWDRGVARGLYSKVSFMNHNCSPNCRKYFDAQRRMHIMSSCDISSGQELFLSYVNPLLSTPMRQVWNELRTSLNDIFNVYLIQAILYQTKCFKCTCLRCQDPMEFGTSLSGLKCKNKADSCQGIAIPIDPLSLESDLKCNLCQQIIGCDLAKIMQETAMNSANQQNAESSDEKIAQDIMETFNNLQRFLPQSNHVMVDLKLRLIDQVIANEALRKEFEDIAIDFCFQLLKLARLIAPGRSKLRGVLSMKYHHLIEKGSSPLVISKDSIDSMFVEDQSVLLLD